MKKASANVTGPKRFVSCNGIGMQGSRLGWSYGESHAGSAYLSLRVSSNMRNKMNIEELGRDVNVYL